MHSILALLTTFLLFSPQLDTPAIPSHSVYKDDQLHLAFEYPAELKPDPALSQNLISLTKKRIEGDKKTTQALNCLTTPLVAVENPRMKNFGFLAISRMDLDCRKENPRKIKLPETVEEALSTAMKPLGPPSMGHPQLYQLAGSSASAVEGKIEADKSVSKAPIYGEATCQVFAHTLLCWNAMSFDKKRLKEILGGSVIFEGKSPEPLVPSELLSK